MNNLSFKMILQLVDRVSDTGNRIAGNMERMSRRTQTAVQKMSNTSNRAMNRMFDPARLERGINRYEQKLQHARSRLMGAAAIGAVVLAPVVRLGKFEHQLALFGNIVDKTKDQLQVIEAELRQKGAKVNQHASAMLEGLEVLLGKGLSETDARIAIESIGRSATATGAQIREMSEAGFAVVDNLKISASSLPKIFDMLAQSGKEGGFELRDMAKHFPGLTASAKNLGITGVEAVAKLGAALQIAMKGAGSPDEAANNLKNFLSKLASPEVVTKFKKMGINIKRELDNATKNGLDPMEYMLVRIHDLAKDDKWIIGELFGDMQVQNFLKPMISNLEEYRRIRDVTMSAEGVIEKDFKRVMNTNIERAKALAIALDTSLNSGKGLATVIKGLIIDLTGVVAAINKFTAANPELTGNIVKAVAAFLALSVASRVLSFVWAMTGRNLFLILKGISKLKKLTPLFATIGKAGGQLFKGLGFGLLALRTVVFTVFAGIAAASAPVWIVFGLIAAAALAIWKYWEPLEAFFTGSFRGLSELGTTVADTIKNAWTSAIEKGADFAGGVASLFGADTEAAKAAFKEMFDFSGVLAGLDYVAAGVSAFFKDLLKPVKLSDAQRAQTEAFGERLGQMIGDAILRIPAVLMASVSKFAEIGAAWGGAISTAFQAEWQKFVAWIEAQIIAIKQFFSFDIKINWPEPPEWISRLGNMMGFSAPDEPQTQSVQGVTTARPYEPVPVATQSTVDKSAMDVLSNISSWFGGNKNKSEPQTIDNSKHIKQSNVFHVKVLGGPASAGNAALSSIKSANDASLRDID
ncbi:MAG: phage tail tape measure protein [Cohaesibacteraceae bacterium]|nr:phage tail tape measure protein [Cohaesibacteraceae bacterium]